MSEYTVHCLYKHCADRVPGRIAYVPTPGGQYVQMVSLDGEKMVEHLTTVDHSEYPRQMVSMRRLRPV